MMIGVQHKPDDQQAHFWGADLKSIPEETFGYRFSGYCEVQRAMGPSIKVINISEDTYVPDEVIQRGNWKDWSKKL